MSESFWCGRQGDLRTLIMRIKFSNIDIFKKNAKRLKAILQNLEVNNPSYVENIDKIKITEIQNQLSTVYGYSSYNELSQYHNGDGVELDALSNSEIKKIEIKFTIAIAEYLIQKGVDELVSYPVAQGAIYHLDRKLEKPTKGKLKEGNFESYKPLAKSYGITIPALKKLLSQDDVLTKTFPHKEALLSGKAKAAIMDNDYGIKIKVLWSEDYIKELMSSQGMKKLEGIELYRLPTGLFKANDGITECAYELARIIEDKHPDTNDRNEYICFDFGCHPHTHWALDYESRWDYLYPRIKVLHLEAKDIDPDRTEFVMSIFKDIVEWVDRYI